MRQMWENDLEIRIQRVWVGPTWLKFVFYGFYIGLLIVIVLGALGWL